MGRLLPYFSGAISLLPERPFHETLCEFIQRRTSLCGVLRSLLPAQASVLQDFNSRATFAGAANSLVNIDFEGTATTESSAGGYTNYYSSYSTSGGLNIDGISFVGVTSTGNSLYTTNAADPNASENYGTETVLKRSRSGIPALTCRSRLPTNITAFGFDLGAMLPSTATFQIDLVSLGVSYEVTTAPRPTLTYWGVTTDSAIGEIRVTTTGGNAYRPSCFWTTPSTDWRVPRVAAIQSRGPWELPRSPRSFTWPPVLACCTGTSAAANYRFCSVPGERGGVASRPAHTSKPCCLRWWGPSNVLVDLNNSWRPSVATSRTLPRKASMSAFDIGWKVRAIFRSVVN